MNFFKERIKEYEECLKISQDQRWWEEAMTVKQLQEYFNRDVSTIRQAIQKMCKAGYGEYKQYEENKIVIAKEGVEWLCKNVFKQKYIQLLEDYKMVLTEQYIEAGYLYDKFFGRN